MNFIFYGQGTPDARCDTEKKKRIALSEDTFTQDEVHLHQQKYQSLHQNQHSESPHNGPSSCMDVNDGH